MAEFACDKCGTFLDSGENPVAICRCDGAFHEPAKEPEEAPAKPLFATPPLEPPQESPGGPMPKSNAELVEEAGKPKGRRAARRRRKSKS